MKIRNIKSHLISSHCVFAHSTPSSCSRLAKSCLLIPCSKKFGPAQTFLDLQHSKFLLQACQELPFRIVIGRYSRHFHSGYLSSSSTRSGIQGMFIEWRNTKETFFPKFDNIFHDYLYSKFLSSKIPF